MMCIYSHKWILFVKGESIHVRIHIINLCTKMLHIFIEHRHENDHLSMNYASGMQNTTRASDFFYTDSGLLMILLTLLL
jgi:hypothetical protein